MKMLIATVAVTGLSTAAIIGATSKPAPHLPVSELATLEAYVAAENHANCGSTLAMKYAIDQHIQTIFAPDTDDATVAQVSQMLHGLGQRFFTGPRWAGALGTPVSLTYSFPPDGLNIPNGIGEGANPNEIFARLDSLFANNGGQAVWKGLFRQMFDDWEEVTGNIYTEVSDDGAGWGSSGSPGLRGDIRISMKPIDGSSGVLAYNSFPSNGDMVIDRQENWDSTSANFRFFRNTLQHENGHGMGLFHVCPVDGTKLMEPFINLSFDGPQLDEVRAMQSLYGDPFEPNGTSGTATSLTALGLQVNTPFSLGTNVSLRNSSDFDTYSFDAGSASTISVDVTVSGFTYNNGPQNGNGSCSPGVPLDALSQQDVLVEILNPSGNPVHTIDDNGFGQDESIVDFNIPSAGTWFVRVRSAASNGDVQTYLLDVTVTDDGLVGDLNGDGCIGATDFAILLGSWGPMGGSADLDGDGNVGSSDLAIILGVWGNGCGM